MGGSVKTAVLPVAGLGTRVLPGAKTTPKNLLNIVDRPILSYIVEEARAAGIEHFVFIVGRGQGAIEDYFDSNPEIEGTLEAKGKLDILADVRRDLPKPGEMSFVRQMAPLGLGHAVWCARHVVGNEPFAVVLPDMLMMAKPPPSPRPSRPTTRSAATSSSSSRPPKAKRTSTASWRSTVVRAA